MFKQVLVLSLASLLTIQVCSENVNISPYDLYDDAIAEVYNLADIIWAAIQAGDSDLDDLTSDFSIYTVNAEQTAAVSIQQEHDIIDGQLTTVKNLAQRANADITYCLRGREDYLDSLPQTIISQLNDCISDKVDEGGRIVDSSKYIIDVTYNKVLGIGFQVYTCGHGNDACISRVLDQIKYEEVNVPDDIKVEVQRSSELFEELKVSVDKCSAIKISEYTSSANSILRDITLCVDAILE